MGSQLKSSRAGRYFSLIKLPLELELEKIYKPKGKFRKDHFAILISVRKNCITWFPFQK
jgi:hypothetical protein